MEKPFHIAFLREITDQYESGDISYSKMVEMLNEIAIKWHEQRVSNPTVSKMETTQTAKEKSLYLIDRFYQTTPNDAWFNPPLGALTMDYSAWEHSKVCAMIFVDEILDIQINDLDNATEFYKYWQEVKQNL